MPSLPISLSLSVPSPIGLLTIEECDGVLVALRWDRERRNDTSPLLERAAAQLAAYFAGKRTTFDLPLAPVGTPFQKRVWAAMSEIPFGETQTYGRLASRLGTAARAVGGACGANPIPVIVPCHRVVAGGARPGGYSGGGGLATKAALLELESRGAGLFAMQGKDVIDR